MKMSDSLQLGPADPQEEQGQDPHEDADAYQDVHAVPQGQVAFEGQTRNWHLVVAHRIQLVPDEADEPVLERRQVLEPEEPDGQVVPVLVKPTEEHEGQDDHRHQHCDQLGVRDCAAQEESQRVAREGYEEEDQVEDEELLGGVGQPDHPVQDHRHEQGDQDEEGQLHDRPGQVEQPRAIQPGPLFLEEDHPLLGEHDGHGGQRAHEARHAQEEQQPGEGHEVDRPDAGVARGVDVVVPYFPVDPPDEQSQDDAGEDSRLDHHGVPSRVQEVSLDDGAQPLAIGDIVVPLLDLQHSLVLDLVLDLGLYLPVVSLEVFGVVAHIDRRLVVQDGHEEVRGVAELGARETHLVEVAHRLLRRALVDRPARHQQDQPAEQVEDLGVGLVDGHDHSLVLVHRQLLQVAADDVGSQRVQPRSRLVQDDHRRVTHQLEGN